MFAKLLIANRGEIACRIIRTARRMGIATVAVFSEADADALHVRRADEAVAIGPSEAAQSYLAIDRIVTAARESGADAIHPGYGFLSENAAFAEACTQAGLVFVGPPPAAIRAMGSKSAAKALMEKAGVPLTPGYHGGDNDPGRLEEEARRIGVPLLIKASAGGGGRGMRRVDDLSAFPASLDSCRREAESAFGDAQVLLERYIERPRHVEVQVFADTHGNAVHLFERDCSVQRRHQKVLEEAPAPGLSGELRRAMAEAALSAARAVGYVGAGTVEFILAPDGRFFFMEMNTRLQVEHPVTEMITGLDLVEWQLRVAAGEPLPLAQNEIRRKGHAIEARIYAEVPEQGFMPSAGEITHLSFPSQGPNLRIDSGVERGDRVTPYYDAMIAKLVVWQPTRELAVTALADALGRCRIVGPGNNVQFLRRLAMSPQFESADLDTSLIGRAGESLLEPDMVSDEALALSIAGELCLRGVQSPWLAGDGFRLNAPLRRLFLRRRNGETVTLVAESGDGREWRISIGSQDMDLAVRPGDTPFGFRVRLGGVWRDVAVVADGGKRHVFSGGRHWAIEAVALAEAHEGGTQGEHSLRAPMPGRIVRLLVTEGARVARGAPLLVLEAMKMEHTVAAPAAGIVAALHFAVGDQVKAGDELASVEPEQP